MMYLHAYVCSVKSHGCGVVLIDLMHAPFCACVSQEIRIPVWSRRKAATLSCHQIHPPPTVHNVPPTTALCHQAAQCTPQEHR